ncbi:hypothetical protein B9Z55_026059 [Caenorhabditis nigoni]|uniref:Uncharacterized protein n=1 Tax=Caenorhabditis nigoni TaxID=1611254 RepID=A0A2G5T1V4_9PELO|nr:hypothetical protein B9Z55_026059 [Caenorhabditis nigoni]
MTLNEKDIKVKPMTNGPKRTKMEPEWIVQPVVVKQENVKSIKMEILDYQEQAEYGHMELHGETSEPERFFRELDHDFGFFHGS